MSNAFAHARILVVVKDASGEFQQKLVLMTSKARMLLANPINEPFERSTAVRTQTDTSMILAVSSESNPVISISVFPKSGVSRHSDIRFDSATKTFLVPDELKISTAMSVVASAQQCTTIAVYQNFTRSFEVAIEQQQQQNDRCHECHIPVKSVEDHAEKCGAKWYVSQRVGVYVKVPVIRCALQIEQPIRILMNGKFVDIKRDGTYFSAMADTLFKITTAGTIELFTTGFTRVRIPIIVEEMIGSAITYKEKMVLMTSCDRSIVCLNGSRYIDAKNALDCFKHNTPLVLCIRGNAGTAIKVEVHSSGADINRYEIPLVKDGKGENRFKIPGELDIASKGFTPKSFDADLPQKKPRRNAY